MLKALLPRRRDLRLVLMSATLNADLFSNYFGGAPVIHIPVSSEYLYRFLENVFEKFPSIIGFSFHGWRCLVPAFHAIAYYMVHG